MQHTPHPVKALPASTVRQIGSTQVLVDPSSVVKELMDNALDARATAIFIEITANTIDSIQVKDNGHGIPSEDRALICRRYCTSKIRDLQDLKEIGGKWLGFRGEAMASMAEVSGALRIWTRVEGEPVAVLLSVGGTGEITSIERASHPVGTTVKVNDFFKTFPVRKQIALDQSAKKLTKIKRLVQAYALARPTVRFGLKVLKAKTDKGNFVYAPRAGSTVEDAVFKVIGRGCASQCDWTVMQSDGFEVHAFLPRPDANGAKIANVGSFLSIDARPVSTIRGMLKQVATAYKERLHKASSVFASLKDPFLCMNIICPPNSYDPNIEPAKDDVLFENEQLVLSIVNKLLISFYPQALVDVAGEQIEPQKSAGQMRGLSKSTTPLLAVQEHDSKLKIQNMSPNTPNIGRQWRSNMYGIDEQDMDLIDENYQPVLDDEEEMRKAVAAFNPWTLAKLNASIKPRKTLSTGQLMTPEKGPGDVRADSSSPIREMASRILPTLEPLTLQTAMRQNMTRSATDMSLERSIQRLPPPYRDDDLDSHQDESLYEQVTSPCGSDRLRMIPPSQSGPFSPILGQQSSVLSSKIVESSSFSESAIHSSEPSLHMGSLDSPTSRPNQGKQQPFRNKPLRSPQRQATNYVERMDDSASQRQTAPSRRKMPAQRRGSLQRFPNDHLASQNLKPNAVEALVDSRLHSDNNTDIRDFLGGSRGHARQQRQGSTSIEPSPESSLYFAPVKSQSNDNRKKLRIHNDQGDEIESRDMATQFRAYANRAAPPSADIYISTSAELQPRSRNTQGRQFDRGQSGELRNIATQLCAYTKSNNHSKKEGSRSRSDRQYERPKEIQDQMQTHTDKGKIPEAKDIGEQLRAYADRVAPAKLIEGVGSQEDSTSNNGMNDTTQAFRPSSKHQSRPKSRRRSTLPHLRTKSSMLPLNHIHWKYRVQNIILPISSPLCTTLSTIANLQRNLNMGTGMNGLEWEYPVPTAGSDEGGGVFEEMIEEHRVMLWCNKLGAWWEMKDGASAVGIMMESVWGALSVRKRNRSEGVAEMIEIVDEENGDADADAMGVEIGGDDENGFGGIEDDEMLMTM